MAKTIVKRILVGLILAVLAALSVVGYVNTKTNYGLVDYLPSDSETSKGYNLIKQQFGSVSYARVMISDIEINAASELKAQMAAVDGVGMVLWLDDIVKIATEAIKTELQKAESKIDEILGVLIPENPADRTDEQQQIYDFFHKIKTDDITDSEVLEYLDQNSIILSAVDLVINYYFDGAISLTSFYDSENKNALIQVYFEEDDYSAKTDKAVDDIKGLCKNLHAAYEGTAISTKAARETTTSEIFTIMIIVVPLAILILILATDAYIEPVLLLLTIGLSVLFNMGTNIVFQWLGLLDGVSFITNSMMVALQMAISMDYSIFILHQYRALREKGEDLDNAVKHAVKSSLLPVTSSCLTTVAGFVAISFMAFKIGKDIGFVFSKAIVISFLVAVLCMPFFIKLFAKAIEKTKHKKLMPDGQKLAKFCVKFGVPIVLVVLVLGGGSYFLQDKLEFVYGESAISASEGTQSYEDSKTIQDGFGVYNPVVIIISTSARGNGNEQKIINDLREITVSTSSGLNKKIVTSILSYGSLYKTELFDMLPEESKTEFTEKLSENFDSVKVDGVSSYTRIVANIAAESESSEAQSAYAQMKTILNRYAPQNSYIVGSTVAASEMKTIIQGDYNTVNLMAIIAVMVIIALSFKSISVPVLLVGTIEIGIFINMGIAQLQGSTVAFLGYLVVSLIQLGATIDYAILYTQNYVDSRKLHDKNIATYEAVRKSIVSILTSASILCVAGYAIKFSSSVAGIADIGGMIGRGALISAVLVLFFLPPLLRLLDKYIPILSLKMKFLMPKKQSDTTLGVKEIERHIARTRNSAKDESTATKADDDTVATTSTPPEDDAPPEDDLTSPNDDDLPSDESDDSPKG